MSSRRATHFLRCLPLWTLSVLVTLLAAPGAAATGEGFTLVAPAMDQPHPRLLVSRESLIEARRRFASGDEPWQASAAALTRAMDAALHREGIALRVDDQPEVSPYYRRFRTDAQAIADLALGWWMTGDNRYAAKAIEVLRAVSGVDVRGTLEGGPGQGMVEARGMIPLAFGYDLLHDHPLMTPDDRQRLDAWLLDLVEEMKIGMNRWRDRDYYNHQDYQNHVAAHTTGMLVVACVVGDQALAQFALDHPDNPRDLIELIAGAILMPGDTPHHREPDGWPIHPGEIYDRYRHFTAPGKGLQYAHLTLSLLTTAAQVLHVNGVDLYGYVAPGGENLELAFAFYSDFHRTGDSSLHGGFYDGESHRIGKAGDTAGLFELGARHYPHNERIRQCVRVSRQRPYQRVPLLGHATLLWGVEEGDGDGDAP